MRQLTLSMAFVVATFGYQFVQAEIVHSSPEHFRLELKAESALSPEELWQRLIVPALWWHSDHTYSGNSANMRIDLQAGGLWREDWDGGSVAHGRVVFADPPRLLRLEAPFGPLQELAVLSIWSIKITPKGAGSVVVFEFLANGSAHSGLQNLAPAVDQVKGQALRALVSGANE